MAIIITNPDAPIPDPTPIWMRLADVGITVSKNKNKGGKHELFRGKESIGFYWPQEAIEKFLK